MHYFCGVLIMKCILLYLEIMGRVVRYTGSSCRPLLDPISLLLVCYSDLYDFMTIVCFIRWEDASTLISMTHNVMIMSLICEGEML